MSQLNQRGRGIRLQPYTAPTLEKLAHEGVKRVDVLCPGFTSDCLETLEEIAMEANEEFLHHGGEEFMAVPCLNDEDEWCGVVANWIKDFKKE